MCIITIKQVGTPMDWSILDTCEKNNPDGSGFAYVKDNRVHIRKGYFDNNDMQKALEKENINLDETEIMFHFRIATHGKVAPSTCHPFPMTSNKSDLTKLRTTTNVAVSHNGIIGDMPTHKTYSDTMQYIRLYLGKLGKDIHRDNIRNLIEHSIGSLNCLAIMTVRKTYLIGEFVEDNGWLHSNDSYQNYQAQSLCTSTGTSIGTSVHDDGSYLDSKWGSFVDYDGNIYDGDKSKVHYTSYPRGIGDYIRCDSCDEMFFWNDECDTLNDIVLCDTCSGYKTLVQANTYKSNKKNKRNKKKKFQLWKK